MGENWEHMHLLLRPGMKELIDKWRIQQPDVPDRNEAVRRMLAKALGQSETPPSE